MHILILRIIIQGGEKMKRKNLFVLDEEDDKVVQLFANLGMPKNLAKSLMYVTQVNECCSTEIEQGADLRQPEVSVAMQELRKRGWIKKRDLKKEGKGRPVHLYKITSNLSGIWKEFERQKLEEVETIEGNLSELKNTINNELNTRTYSH